MGDKLNKQLSDFLSQGKRGGGSERRPLPKAPDTTAVFYCLILFFPLEYIGRYTDDNPLSVHLWPEQRELFTS